MLFQENPWIFHQCVFECYHCCLFIIWVILHCWWYVSRLLFDITGTLSWHSRFSWSPPGLHQLFILFRLLYVFLFCEVIHFSSPLAKKPHWSPDLRFERAFLPSGIVYLSLVHHFWQLNLEGSRANAVVQNSVLVQLFIWITQKSTCLILRALSKQALFKHVKYFWTITCGEKFSC